jgi:hypothetical protein
LETGEFNGERKEQPSVLESGNGNYSRLLSTITGFQRKIILLSIEWFASELQRHIKN